jgi:Kef-type K+ transport system membrane component KefB
VIDDILAMLLLGVVVSLQGGEGFDLFHLVMVLVGAIGFIAVIGWGGTRVMRWNSNVARKAAQRLLAPVDRAGTMPGLAYVSTLFGLAAIIGAFLAGMIASETRQQHTLEQQIQPLLALAHAILLRPDRQQDRSASTCQCGCLDRTSRGDTVIAIISKLLGGFLGALSLGRMGAAIVGFGMVPRGEVGVVIASLGLAAGVFNDQMYAIIVAMSLLTAMVTPPILAWLLRRTVSETTTQPRDA